MPTTWEAPAEPGPEVTHVRDRFGRLCRRDGDLWWVDPGRGWEDYYRWHELLWRGPLTDATGDA
jgi:hypothetical protein